jgi:hypothetical protein
MSETIRTMVPVILIGLGVCWLLFAAVMLWRSRQQNRRWQHESRVHQRIAELLEQEYINLLTPEERQRRETYRQHVQQLRAQAEAELAAGASRRRGE